ncbi:type IV inositol polyphosphate 5-phosphatase 11 [Cryptomeria japonica]|uniref:type IV inositol polyphosphate 5-phosphatase 11 n=1 Tax=Cryptomeria japonica TaxID=3369 RepID=UPI0025AC69DA|nr:type IV inositol polyphosphate 5-phosphatase 11 [Cryptomeria japonica]
MGNCVCRGSERNRVEKTSGEEMCRNRTKFKATRNLRVFPRDEIVKKCHEGIIERNMSDSDKMGFSDQRRLCQKETVERGAIKRVENKSGWLLNGGSDLCMYIVTWNMNSKVACHDMLKLLGRKRGSFDFYVVGLQEAPHVDIASFIQKALGRNYSMVRAATMQSLRLYIFGRKSLDSLIRDVRVDKIKGGGLGGVVGRQKGAVAISFDFINTSFIFISCHLAPHQSNVEERNSQYQRISQTIFSDSTSRMHSPCLQSPNRLTDPLGLKKESKVISPTSLETSDVVVWLGDLNYRIEGSRNSVGSLINQNFQQLRAKDQLSREAEKGEIFHGFCEGPLSFRPTYKYDIGTDDYDTSTKRRVPSWTDRILYKINSGGNVKAHVEDYDSIDSIKGSDHRPVKAHLCIKFRRPLVNHLQTTTSCSCMH